MNEEVLTGGNVNRVVRIENTVRRTMGVWSPGVHALLQHLHEEGFTGAPQFLGIDDAGRETLTFIPGSVAGDRYPHLPQYMWSDAALVALARLLRQFHDACEGFRPPAAAFWQLTYPDPRQHEVICHNDAALYNVVFRNDLPVALIDFDMAGPGPRLWDIAYTVYTVVPLATFSPDSDSETTIPYAKRDAIDRKRRLTLFFESYGLPMPEDLQDWVIRRLRALCDGLLAGAAEGRPAFQKMVDEGHVTHYQREVSFLERQFPTWMP